MRVRMTLAVLVPTVAAVLIGGTAAAAPASTPAASGVSVPPTACQVQALLGVKNVKECESGSF
ncbi:MAG: hypothetical protein JWN87_2891 [Frankiales bacterium]|jgi:hypothetical protein|nr:hypothetical protein [Frankiales bacterium]